MKATEFLHKAASLLEERGKQYDQPQGERSMGKAVTAFNAITSRDLSEAEGWLLLQLLKDVRQWQRPDGCHMDSIEDCISYAALKAESIAIGQKIGSPISAQDLAIACAPIDPAASIDDDSPRAQAIGQNGNTGEHYAKWDESPAWATHAMIRLGRVEFAMERDGKYWDGPSTEDGRFLLANEATGTPWTVLEARPCQ